MGGMSRGEKRIVGVAAAGLACLVLLLVFSAQFTSAPRPCVEWGWQQGLKGTAHKVCVTRVPDAPVYPED